MDNFGPAEHDDLTGLVDEIIVFLGISQRQ